MLLDFIIVVLNLWELNICLAHFWQERFNLNSTIPDKRVGTQSKFSPPPTFNVDNQVIFALFVGKNVIFSNSVWRGRGMCDTAQVSQLLLAGIVCKGYARNFLVKVTPAIVMVLQYFRIWFQLNGAHFVSGNWTEPFYDNLDWVLVLIFMEYDL